MSGLCKHFNWRKTLDFRWLGTVLQQCHKCTACHKRKWVDIKTVFRTSAIEGEE